MRLNISLVAILSYSLATSAQSSTSLGLQAGNTIQLPSGEVANDVAVINASGGALPDLLVPTQGSNTLNVYIQPRLHSFGRASNYPSQQPQSVVPLNFTTGSTAVPPTDFVVLTANGNLTPWRRTNGIYQAGAAIPIRQGLACAPTDRLVCGNYLPGGGLDLGCLSNGPQPSIAQIGNMGNGVFQAGFPLPRQVGDSALVLATADFDHDFYHLEDAVVPQLDDPTGSFDIYPRQTADVRPQTAWWSYFRATTLPSGGTGNAQSIATGDVDGDTYADVVIGASSGSGQGILYVRRYLANTAPFTFSAAIQSYPVLAVPREVRLADLNGDGRPELLVLGENGTLNVFTNTSATSPNVFDSLPSVFQTGLDPATMCVADADADGDLDVLVPCRGDGTIRVFWNTPQLLASTSAAFAAGLSVYPNPASTVLHIAGPSTVRKAQATLLDLAGRTVRQWNVETMGGDLNVGDLSRGLYVLQITSATGKAYRRIELY